MTKTPLHNWLRIIIVLALGTSVWKAVTYWHAFNHIPYLAIAMITTVSTVIILELVRRWDQLSWSSFGMGSFRTNVFSFLLGLFIWTIPATIGIMIAAGFGWVELVFIAEWKPFLLGLTLLMGTVLFMEALPEELIFRGMVYRYLHAMYPHWASVILQTVLFSAFAALVGAMYSIEQIQFIPGFALILGYIRAVTGNVWTTIGFHFAMMTVTQSISPVHGYFEVDGLFTLRFFSFVLLPSAIGAIVLSFMFPNHRWGRRESGVTTKDM